MGKINLHHLSRMHFSQQVNWGISFPLSFPRFQPDQRTPIKGIALLHRSVRFLPSFRRPQFRIALARGSVCLQLKKKEDLPHPSFPLLLVVDPIDPLSANSRCCCRTAKSAAAHNIAIPLPLSASPSPNSSSARAHAICVNFISYFVLGPDSIDV